MSVIYLIPSFPVVAHVKEFGTRRDDTTLVHITMCLSIWLESRENQREDVLSLYRFIILKIQVARL
jgi:hypothetical protein